MSRGPSLFWLPATGEWHCSVCIGKTDVAHSWSVCARNTAKRASQVQRHAEAVEAMAAQYLARAIALDTKFRDAREELNELRTMIDYLETFYPNQVDDARSFAKKSQREQQRAFRRREARLRARAEAVTEERQLEGAMT